ncbi:nSTAND1 domain-containing NTPase [Streptomyces anulatus]|uniref:nSTAND1 domain-containing NTPase n=1 Tax=Streptomyces anulatus TaxID=1892 RepID=UPI002B1CD2A6|nr:hypothetical protein [Streptomyces anulatus]
MGRPENPIDPQSGPVGRFAHDLRKLRDEAGAPAYRAMARRAGYSAATLSQAAAGERLPTLPVLLAYVGVCRGDSAEWQDRWEQANAELLRCPRPPEEDTEPPYRGLARFEPDDADLFFGRDRVIDDLLELAHNSRVTAVVGASGSGKSSLLRAGIVPRLRNTDHLAQAPAALRIITPGAHPLGTHEQRLTPVATTGGDEGAATWLIVDQFEEIFTLCRDPIERTAFIDRLLTADEPGSRLRVLIALRADFYNRCLEHHNLITVLRNATVPVGPMNADELREAIVKPAAARGLIVERGLTARILQDIDGEPGALPLMSHALLETWRRRRGKALTEAAYDATDGLHGAITHTAETAYTSLTPTQAVLARRILLRLITPGEGTQDTRRPINRTELDTADPTDTNAVLERLTSARLLTIDGSTIDLAHEALITAWPRLRGWVEEDRERLRIHRQLTEAARVWDDLDREPGALYRGSRLAVAEEAFAAPGAQDELTAQEEDFLTTSTTTRTHEEQFAARSTRRLRRLTVTLSVLLVLALTAGLAAWDQYRTSDKERRKTATAQRVAQSRELAAQSAALLDSNTDLASLLAVHAYRTQRTPQALRSLQAAAAVPLRQKLTGRSHVVYAVAFSPDGQSLATTADDERVRLWDTATGRVHKTLPLAGVALSLAFSPDGRTLAAGGDGGGVKLWDTSSGRVRETLGERTGGTIQVAFSPDGLTLAIIGGTSGLSLWDTSTGKARTSITPQQDTVSVVAFSPDGQTLATSGEDKAVRLWNADTGSLRRTLTGSTGLVRSLGFSPDGRTLVTASNNARGTKFPVQLWDTSTGRLLRSLDEQTNETSSLAFSPDGRTLATGSDDRMVQLWDTASGSSLAVLSGHAEGVMSVAFSPDGRTLATSAYERTIRLWDMTATRTRAALVPENRRPISDVTFSPDGRTLATSSEFPGGGVDMWDVTSPRTRPRLSFPGEASSVRFSPDGRTLLSTSHDGVSMRDAETGHPRKSPSIDSKGPSVRDRDLFGAEFSPDGRTLAATRLLHGAEVWDLDTNRLLYKLPRALSEGAYSVAFSPDGHTLATGGNRIRLWDAATGRLRKTLTGHSDEVTFLAFSPDGDTLASAGNDQAVRLWDTATDRLRKRLPGYINTQHFLEFSPDNRTLATAGIDDRTVQLWDTETATAVTTLSGYNSPTIAVAFSPDGRTLATGNGDRTIRLWNVALPTPAAAISKICRAVGRELTEQEHTAYLPDQTTGRTCPA